MKLDKTALANTICTALIITTTPAQATHLATFEGFFTLIHPSGTVIRNFARPYYYDTTWDYGLRTPITGTLTGMGHGYPTLADSGSGTITPFNFDDISRQLVFHDFTWQAIGDGFGGDGSLIMANLVYDLVSNIGTETHIIASDVAVDIVMDRAGLIDSYAAQRLTLGSQSDFYRDLTTDTGALPASNNNIDPQYHLGPALIATTGFNTDGLSVGIDDGIGGSPMSSSHLTGHSINIDITSAELGVLLPVPASIWLFGSGLLGLIGLVSRRRTNQ